MYLHNTQKNFISCCSSSAGVSSYLLTQKKASCGHYMPSFDTHRQCKQCRLSQGQRCKSQGKKCEDCEGWSEELWGFVTSMYPESEEEGEVEQERRTEKESKDNVIKQCVYLWGFWGLMVIGRQLIVNSWSEELWGFVTSMYLERRRGRWNKRGRHGKKVKIMLKNCK